MLNQVSTRYTTNPVYNIKSYIYTHACARTHSRNASEGVEKPDISACFNIKWLAYINAFTRPNKIYRKEDMRTKNHKATETKTEKKNWYAVKLQFPPQNYLKGLPP